MESSPEEDAMVWKAQAMESSPEGPDCGHHVQTEVESLVELIHSGREIWMERLARLVQLLMAFASGFLLNAIWHTHKALDEVVVLDRDRTLHSPASPKHFLEASPAKDQAIEVFTTATTSIPSTVVALRSHPSANPVSTSTLGGSDYWNYCGGGSSCPKLLPYGGAELPADEQFLLFDVRGAGWNNDRSSIELGYALAFLWRRTLVLPEWMGNPCAPNSLERVNNTFDIQAMKEGISVITATEFIEYAKAHPHRFLGGAEAVARLDVRDKDVASGTDWRTFTGWISGLEDVAEMVFPDVREVCGYVTVGAVVAEDELARIKASWEFRNFAASRGKRTLALSEEQAAATALYIGPRKLLGNFYSMIYVPDPMIGWQLRNTIRRAVHLHSSFFDAAIAALKVAGLAPGRYGAIHNRQGDFQQAYRSFWLDPKHPEQFLKQPQNVDFLERHGRIFMAVRATPPQMQNLRTVFFPALKKLMPEPKLILTLDDKVSDAAMALVGHRKGWQGIVDMIICAQAEEFLGSWGSTFTGYIHRLRGYMPFIADKRLLYTDNSKDRIKYEFPSWGAKVDSGQLSWMREWPEGHQL